MNASVSAHQACSRIAGLPLSFAHQLRRVESLAVPGSGRRCIVAVMTRLEGHSGLVHQLRWHRRFAAA